MLTRFKAAPKAIFQTAVGTTAVALTTTTGINAQRGVEVKSLSTGTAIVYIGLDTSVSSTTGWPLAAGEKKRFFSSDPSKLFAIASAASQGVAVSAE